MVKSILKFPMRSIILGCLIINSSTMAREAPAPLDAETVLSETVTDASKQNMNVPTPDGTSDLRPDAPVAADPGSVSTLYPLDRTPGFKSKTPELLQDEFEMNIDRDVVNRVLKQQRRYQRIINGIHDVAFLQKPITKPFSAVDTIYVTTEYITTIIFPKGLKIQYADSGEAFDINRFDQNALWFQPKRNFQGTNMVIGLTDGNQNYVVTITIEKYLPGNIVKDNVEERYLSCGEYISTMIRYINPPKIESIDVLKKYFSLFGDNSIKKFRKNGAFDVITIGGMPFYIIRDDRRGDIVYQDVSFRISDRYEQFVELTKGRK